MGMENSEENPSSVEPKPKPKPEAEPEPSVQAEKQPEPSVEADMARASSSPMIPPTSWFTPKRLLIIFCLINLLNYVDRGAIASNGVNGTRGVCTTNGTCTAGTGIQGEFNLSNFEDGILSSAFMVGLLVASPIFASLAKSVNPFRLIGVGLLVWTVAVLGCGFSFTFWFIAVCRMFVGVGEASFISLAAPFIDDNAPVAQKTAWLAVFYMCIPGGYAFGYVYGGLVGNRFGWRLAFWVEAILMIPFIIMGFTMKPLQLKGFAPAESKKAVTQETLVVKDIEAANGKDDSLSSQVEFGDKRSDQQSIWSKYASKIWDQIGRFMKDLKALFLEKVFVVNVLGTSLPPTDILYAPGYIVYNFVIGAYSYWGPKAGFYIYNMTNADMIFGGITVVCGILGTLAGGFALDYMSNTISNAFKLLSLTTLLGAAFCLGGFLFRNMYGFLALFAVGELLVFATQAPVNFICLHCVNPSLRPISMAISTVAIHILGDVPSSPLVGIFQDRVNNWRTTALVLTAILFLAAVIWFIGVFMPSVDRFNEDSSVQVETIEKPNATPNTKETVEEAPSQHQLSAMLLLCRHAKTHTPSSSSSSPIAPNVFALNWLIPKSGNPIFQEAGSTSSTSNHTNTHCDCVVRPSPLENRFEDALQLCCC
ncbi:putative sphingolipid transporter spinster-like protein 2 [Senna tora]|uniref:Putative sphingolipid transporter spinster-like protein 2 n=1 Tax=Senna tora TaxID=362788 RepID=A0A834SUQ3_9FABA|nr:putative sphingolipid transporter spinster-like protein 2 [Senna tora]